MSYIDIITRVNDDHERPTLIRIGGLKTKATVLDYNDNFENEIKLPDAAIPEIKKVIQKVLDKYIPYLTVIGGAFVGALAALATFSGALAGGTGVLLTVGIVYKLYEEIASEQMMDMHPAIRDFIGDHGII